MQLVLKNSDFVNGRLYVDYGSRQQAKFIIIDENFSSLPYGSAKIERIVCITRRYDSDGVTVMSSQLNSLVIGIGIPGAVGATTLDTTLLGKDMTKDNMEQCMVTLYEAEDV